MEDLIASYPDDFLEPGWKLHQRQGIYEGRRIDLIFKDIHGRTLLVELKRGVVERKHVGQIIEYYGLLKKSGSMTGVELLLIGNNIPHERREYLFQSARTWNPGHQTFQYSDIRHPANNVSASKF